MYPNFVLILMVLIVILEETPSDSFSHKHAGSRLAIGGGLSFRVRKENIFDLLLRLDLHQRQ